MAGRQQQQEGWGPDRNPPLNPEDDPDVPISVPLVSQAPMNPALDDQRDGIGNETNSISSIDTHEFLREVDGRQYNSKNTTYLLPAGKWSRSPPSYSQLPWVSNLSLHAFCLCTGPLFPDRSLTSSFPSQTKSSMFACGYPNVFKTKYLAYIHHCTLFFSGKHHMRQCISLGDELYPHPKMVESVLRPEPGVEKKILDIG